MLTRTNRFKVGMPHLAPEKLSEVELLRLLGAYRWEVISQMWGVPSHDIVNRDNERLYASFINIELNFGRGHLLETLSEGTLVQVDENVSSYAGKFVEGVAVLSTPQQERPPMDSLETLADARRLDLPWVYMTNAFVAPRDSNNRLLVCAPVGSGEQELPRTAQLPLGIAEHEEVQTSGVIQPFEEAGPAWPLSPRDGAPIPYDIALESDINGAGLVYFCRYVSIMNYAERVLLTERLGSPLSIHAVASLSTERRRLFYFANAGPADKVEVVLSAQVMPPGDEQLDTGDSPFCTMARFLFRADLFRCSDRTLMASSLAQKAMNVHRSRKAVIKDVQRFLARS